MSTDLEKAQAYLRDAIEDLYGNDPEILDGADSDFLGLRETGQRKRLASLRSLHELIDESLEKAAEKLIGDDAEAATLAKEAAIDLLLARGHLRKIGREVAGG